jgi:dTDP-4-amino-4,6-dideoxy-D-galactose acyltransferase
MGQCAMGAVPDDGSRAAEERDRGDPLCIYRKWDSDFFGRRIASANVNRLTEQTVRDIRMWCEDQRIDCLYFLADSADPETIMLAENTGFRLVDIRMTLERKIDSLILPASTRGLIRRCREDDLSSLRHIARVSHLDSRFYYDKNFPKSCCDALYETWIDKSAHGLADVVLVAAVREEAVGYISCELPHDGEPQIGLFAVAENARGSGLGTHLIMEALHWFKQKGAVRVRVVTQGRNIPGQRLYQRCGFVTCSMQLWYHFWPRLSAHNAK